MIIINEIKKHHDYRLEMILSEGAPDFALFAKACGAEGIRLEEPEMLKEAIGKAMVYEQPVVIDIFTRDEKPGFI